MPDWVKNSGAARSGMFDKYLKPASGGSSNTRLPYEVHDTNGSYTAPEVYSAGGYESGSSSAGSAGSGGSRDGNVKVSYHRGSNCDRGFLTTYLPGSPSGSPMGSPTKSGPSVIN